MDQDSTDITVVLDRSGSMSSIRWPMEGGLERFIDSQRQVPGACHVSLIQFDTKAIEVVFTAIPVADVRPIRISPRGGTPLHDAMAIAINSTGERLAAMPADDRPAKVLMLVITDGAENASRETTAAQVRAMIQHQQEVYSWEFIFLAANVNAFREARRMGIDTTRAVEFGANADDVGDAFAVLGDKFSKFRNKGTRKDLEFTEGERGRMKKF